MFKKIILTLGAMSSIAIAFNHENKAMGGFVLNMNEDHHVSSIIVNKENGLKIADKHGPRELVKDNLILWEVEEGAYTAGGVFHTGSCEAIIPLKDKPSQNYVFVLKAFNFYLTDGGKDMHLKKIQVQEQDEKLYISFCDKHKNKGISAIILYNWIDKNSVSEKLQIEGETFYQIDSQPITEGHIVISGFNFEFKKNDHHLLGIAINEFFSDKGRLSFRFGDESANSYRYQIDYAHVL